ncbi:MAG: hypothetical protein R6U29_02570 [Desulfosudaceae bacterium]
MMTRWGIIRRGKIVAGLLFLLVLLGGTGMAVCEEHGQQDRCDHIYRFRAMETLYDSKASDLTRSGPKDDNDINRVLARIADMPLLIRNRILPFKDSAGIARRIDALLQELEHTEESEKTQIIRFNLAYEYFLFYLSFLHEKFLLDFQKEAGDVREIDIQELISNQELSLYLLQAQLYLQPLIDQPRKSDQPDNGYRSRREVSSDSDGGTSYTVRDDSSLYLNADFIAFMIECEKLVGQPFLAAVADQEEDVYDAGPPSVEAVRYFDQKTWFWLDILWKRYLMTEDKSGREVSSRRRFGDTAEDGFTSYRPSAQTLYSFYRVYLKYHFMWRYVAGSTGDSPFFNTLTRVLFERLDTLQAEAGLNSSVYYRHYQADTARDGGQTNFMPALFFARRGYAVARLVHHDIAPDTLFDLYGTFYKQVPPAIKNNIPFRSRIYNELIIFGIRLNDLNLMEETLYPFAKRSIRISDRDDYRGTEFARSPRLVTAYLLARLLDAKKNSGLLQGAEQYRDLAEALSPLLISKDNQNWRFAADIHYALAVFYSRENLLYNDSLAMYHARQAFLAPCEKVTRTYGPDRWNMFFSLPYQERALESLKLFLYFHNKYSSSPEAAIPRKFKADKIIDQWVRTSGRNEMIDSDEKIY